MQVISALNLKEGKVYLGDQAHPSQLPSSIQDPLVAARQLAEGGVDKLHVVDIDAALQTGSNNWDIVRKIIEQIDIPVQVAGGIRQLIQIDQLLHMGVDQVVLGTIAVQYPQLLYQIIRNFGAERIAVSLDILGNEIKFQGWQKGVNMPIQIYIRMVESQGVNRIIFTDIERVHTMQGINYEKIAEIARYARAKLTVAGGIRSIQDIENLEKLRRYRVDSIIIGKAIFSSNMALLEEIRQYRLRQQS